jgi:hypothetical protein
MKANAFAKTPAQQKKRQDWHLNNAAKVAQQAKARWATNKAAYEPARQQWAKDNRDKMLVYQHSRREGYVNFIDGLKHGLPCMDCEIVYSPYVMDYDHVRGIKRFNIGKMTNHKRYRILEEIAKCDLVCCACHRIRSHARRDKASTPKLVLFKSWINDLKANPCLDCGRTYPPEAMDFDHVNGDKEAGIAQMWSWGRDKVLAEIAKCELVCANCHRERSIHRLRAYKGREAA